MSTGFDYHRVFIGKDNDNLDQIIDESDLLIKSNNIMICMCCNKFVKDDKNINYSDNPKSNYTDIICNSCKTSTLYMIGYNDILKTYKVSPSDLNDMGFFYIECNTNGKPVIKYIRDHVDQYAYNLTKDLDHDDMLKRAYSKHHFLYMEKLKKHALLLERRRAIRDNLASLLTKLDEPYDIDKNEYIVSVINQCVKNENESILEAVNWIVNYVKCELDAKKKKENRIKRLNDAIDKMFDPNDQKLARSLPAYNDYIIGKHKSFKEAFNRIQMTINMSNEKNNRKQAVSVWIRNNISTEDRRIANVYLKTVGGSDNIEYTKRRIMQHIKKIKEFKEKAVSMNLYNSSVYSKYETEYLNDIMNRITLDDIIKRLKKEHNLIARNK